MKEKKSWKQMHAEITVDEARKRAERQRQEERKQARVAKQFLVLGGKS